MGGSNTRALEGVPHPNFEPHSCLLKHVDSPQARPLRVCRFPGHKPLYDSWKGDASYRGRGRKSIECHFTVTNAGHEPCLKDMSVLESAISIIVKHNLTR